ncbi:MAG: glucose-1-phosphate adenylyltransferase [Betaproteobacteria bacterium RIFCSPLOWO2_02_FULL_62_17]|nr:MAG: glucose-1-phosphate adenylyltransferase [Betaproteobacteria bacterium RIFCSPLOWO2_02_FULL_62_17]
MDRFSAMQLPRRAMALVLAGGRGARLKELTARRAKPAVYFGGKFRIIDFALSNCVNSGVRRIGVITQYESNSLLRHVQKGWGYLRWEMNEFVELLPAQQQKEDESWYRGTADAVWQNIGIIRDHHTEYIVVLAGDHVYKMDYSRMLQFHVERGAQCTVACIEVPRAEAPAFGVMAADRSHRILDFAEKPANPQALPGKPERSLASMGIYVFNTGFLLGLLERDIAIVNSSHDFGRDIIPEAVRMGVACAHPFSLSCVGADPEAPYWRDVGTVDAYWSANIDLTTPTPALDMYDTNWPIWTYQEQLPPAKFVFDRDDRRGMAVDSIVSGGCIISGSRVARSVLFSKCRVNSYCSVEGAVLLPGVEVGRNARLRNVVVDRGCRIPEGMTIGEDAAADAAHFYRTDQGVTLVTQDALDHLARTRA